MPAEPGGKTRHCLPPHDCRRQGRPRCCPTQSGDSNGPRWTPPSRPLGTAGLCFCPWAPCSSRGSFGPSSMDQGWGTPLSPSFDPDPSPGLRPGCSSSSHPRGRPPHAWSMHGVCRLALLGGCLICATPRLRGRASRPSCRLHSCHTPPRRPHPLGRLPHHLSRLCHGHASAVCARQIPRAGWHPLPALVSPLFPPGTSSCCCLHGNWNHRHPPGWLPRGCGLPFFQGGR